MQRTFFLELEEKPDSTLVPLDTVLENLAFDSKGLIPVIAQDATTKEVLMLAWMNKDALLETMKTGFVTYWSRSRNELWRKGKTSGHTQKLLSLSIDCDGDTILCLVDQHGAACHTGRRCCFYLKVNPSSNDVLIEGSQNLK